MARPKTQYLHTTILIIVVLFVWVLSCGDVAAAFDFHADSAHGNESYGVNRSGTGYPIGDCAHCHDTFAPSTCGVNNFMLFYDDWVTKSDMFCFRCHSSIADVEQEVTNESYCVTFGGRSSSLYTNIKTHFTNDNSKPANCGSRHQLGNVRNFIKNNAKGWGFDSDADACVACHPPHAAQRNHPVAIDGEGKLNTAIRRPSDYKSTDPQYFLWGDDEGERMSDYAASVGGTYQAPYYGDTSGAKFEPSGNASPSDGSDLPDYVTFCLDCHQYAQYDSERSAEQPAYGCVKAIDWSSTGDRHGAAPANTCNAGPSYEGTLKAPYSDDANSNYVLSCLDCHEPHGTHKRLHLIRRMINGQLVDAQSTVDPLEEACDQSTDWAEICEKCHNWPHPGWGSCNGPECHGKLMPPPEFNQGGFHGGWWNVGTTTGCDGEPAF